MKKKNKILLVQPRRPVKGISKKIPLSILSLAGPLLNAGFDPIIIDSGVEERWKERIDEVIDDILFAGISTMTGKSIAYGLEIARYIKNTNSNIKLVWGGVHPTLIPEQTLENPLVDIVVKGEGEETIVELAQCLQEDGDIKKVLGVSFKENGLIVQNNERDFIDFNKVPAIPYELMNLKKYAMDEFLYYQSSRGCPHRCEFCDVLVMNRRLCRAKSVTKVLDELTYIANIYHPQVIEFVDDNFFVDKSRVEEICRGIIERGLKFKWVASSRANYFPRFDQAFLKLVKDSGCDYIYVGAESGSQRILDYLKKDIQTEDIVTALEKLKAARIGMRCAFMCGFPEETKEDLEETIVFINKLTEIAKDPSELIIYGILIYAPYPATPLFKKLVEIGYKPPDSFEKWSSFRHNQQKNITWHSKQYRYYLHALAQVSMFRLAEAYSANVILKDVLKLNYKNFILKILRNLSTYRWSKQYFGFPIDIWIIYFIDQYYMGGME